MRLSDQISIGNKYPFDCFKIEMVISKICKRLGQYPMGLYDYPTIDILWIVASECKLYGHFDVNLSVLAKHLGLSINAVVRRLGYIERLGFSYRVTKHRYHANKLFLEPRWNTNRLVRHGIDNWQS